MYLGLILAVLAVHFVIDVVSDWLNVRHMSPEIPEEFKGCYDDEKYAESQRYLRETTRFSLIQNVITTPVTMLFIGLGGLGWLQSICLSYGLGMIPTGLIFMFILMLVGQITGLPFSIYETFVIEARYGFNKTSPKTFIADQFKGILLTLLLGFPLLTLLLFFFQKINRDAWIYAFLATTIFQLFIMYIAPVTILPLFNKFTPLADGSLKQRIQALAQQCGFTLSGIFEIDGSRRSTKSNAYFTGFGRWRRIALYDTLIQNHTEDELVAVLGHEIGHWKKGHIRKQLIISLILSAVMFKLMALFIFDAHWYQAVGISYEAVNGTAAPFYAGMMVFMIVFSPLNYLLSIFGNALSRRFEYQADRFAAETLHSSEPMISALKKLSVDNLSNLTPHPLVVALEYSHPPVIQRIAALRGIAAN
ncbi:MAG: M48 family peptidase [Spartobacteria bacterium]|nr:M48 family peptidase [Spartobacteria bacterium]